VHSLSTAGSGGNNGVGPQTPSVEGGSSTDDPLNAADNKVHSFEVSLVLEYCDWGCLRDALDGGAFFASEWRRREAKGHCLVGGSRRVVHLPGMFFGHALEAYGHAYGLMGMHCRLMQGMHWRLM
jgi:hypothetical protein